MALVLLFGYILVSIELEKDGDRQNDLTTVLTTYSLFNEYLRFVFRQVNQNLTVTRF